MSVSISYQNNPVRPIPGWFCLIPIFGSNLAFAAFKKIYLPRKVFERVTTGKKTEQDESVLIHESVHIMRQIEDGAFFWTFKYLTKKPFRLEEELLAIEAQMKFLKSKNLEYDIKRKAKQFSNATYLWLMKESEAQVVLSSLWRKTSKPLFK